MVSFNTTPYSGCLQNYYSDSHVFDHMTLISFINQYHMVLPTYCMVLRCQRTRYYKICRVVENVQMDWLDFDIFCSFTYSLTRI